MKRFFIALAVFLVWSFFGLWLYSWLKPNNDTAKIDSENTRDLLDNELQDNEEINGDALGDSIIPIISIEDSLFVTQENIKEISAVAPGLKAITNDGDIIFLYKEGIIITKNSPEIVIPKSSVDFKYKLNTYMLEHPDREIHIASLYSADENITSPNLGIQRGMKIKEILVNMGISSDKIVVRPFIKEIDFTTNNTFSNSFTFSFKPIDTKRISTLKNKIPESTIVYPNFSTTGIMVNENLKTLLAEVVQIVEENPDINVEVIGHTDNVGNANDNFIMGLQFARQVRWYLINKGKIDSAKIKATSRGEAEPIDSNHTESGRNANRRVEVKFYMNL
ncbi:OmpA family protein [Ulvibacter sp. MAR_2010_11]|uniref:OmpA family protein n=1 Tax=Ulvibacter sp. MAR_2010_11 TaxID=1250229 RepID=UPI000C2C6A27|nr:OmpA family protein [Ulvibacter sp. MAR_2010_11]PKA84115.1 OmpA family protein [Ulvibacter sp. MAR_2010_11]